jgi:hypothetical protein
MYAPKHRMMMPPIMRVYLTMSFFFWKKFSISSVNRPSSRNIRMKPRA